jgi:uncharacterized membrane protein YfcA
MPIALLLLTAFFASFTHGLTGFGSALIATPILAELLGVRVAAPLVALMGAVMEISLLLRYRGSLDLGVVWRLTAASALLIPLGVWSLEVVEEALMLSALGLVVVGYALYGLLDLQLPELRHPSWAFAAGALAGLLGGAYATVGPPVILYGHCRRWAPETFKANLQGFFLIMSLWIVINHGLHGNLTAALWRDFALALAAIPFGLWAGLRLSHRLDPALFRRIVLLALLALGLRLIL